MECLQTDASGAGPGRPVNSVSEWLASLLAAYAACALSPAQACSIRLRLKHVGFADIILAVERAPPAVREAGERRLYEEWIAANDGSNPQLFAAWFNLGVFLARKRDHANAAIAYSNARALKPDFNPAAVNLGLTFETLGQTNAALRAWQEAVQPDEDRTTLLNHRARLLEGVGRLDEAGKILQISLLTNPAQPDAIQHWIHIRQKMCQWPVLPAGFPGLPPEDLLHDSGPLGVMALTDDVASQRDVTGSWIARKMPLVPLRLCPPEGYRHERIRIGYLSSDFCRHAMSYLIAELFERHDRSRFEVFGYCSTIDDGSAIRKRVLAAFDHLRMIKDLPDREAAQVIRDDEIDVLIDLNGLTAHTRLAVLRWRPAPVQATYLGFVGPVPLPELDYLLCDNFVIPPDRAADYAPEPLPVARNYQANDSKREIGRALSRSDAGLPEGRFVFCCFSNHYKITESMFAAWTVILQQADNALLWLTTDNQWSQANLTAAAARAGIAPERIIFAERTSPELYMSRLRLADLFLDTFPYNAGTIASDALRMGLPLLTLSGAAFASRMAGSLLTAMGAGAGIATDVPDYIAKAVGFATDAGIYAGYKQLFTAAAWERSVGNIARFTQEFEATLSGLTATAGQARHSPAVRPRIIYLCPADDVPTGGIKVIYRHAELLASLGTDAYVLHPQDLGFACTWFNHRARVLRSLTLDPGRDFVVIPELWAGLFGPQCMDQGVRFAVFVQNGYLTHPVLPEEPYELFEKIYRAADAILSISDDTARIVALNYPRIEEQRIVRVRYSMSERFQGPANRNDPESPAITFIPRNMTQHAVLVVNALRQQLPPHWRMQAIDDVNETTVATMLASSRIFLSFSESAGLPLSPLEAALAGNVVIGYTGQGASESWVAPNFHEIQQGDIRGFVAAVCQAAREIDALRLTRADLQSGIDQLAKDFSAASEVSSLQAMMRTIGQCVLPPLRSGFGPASLQPPRQLTPTRGGGASAIDDSAGHVAASR